MKQKDIQSIDELINRIQEYNPKANFEIIKKAYDFAEKFHEDQFRLSGEPFVNHPLNVAFIAAEELKMDTESIAAALLHDLLEDTNVTKDLIEKEFGHSITYLVQSLTKIKNINFSSKSEEDAENIRRIIIATSKDIRVILLKLCDRIHNMRTLKHLSKSKQIEISLETREIYAPIAHKLGIYKIKGELEDLSFKYLEPNLYQDIKSKINEKAEARDKKVSIIMDRLKEILKKNKIAAEVKGRKKSFWSIYNKIIKRKYNFEDLADLLAFRIVVKNTEDCYRVLKLISDEFGKKIEYTDYIINPKPNGYQSIHTKVYFGEDLVEVQIRSLGMHQEAESGIAAHWRYKNASEDKKFDQKISWIKQILEWKESFPDLNARDFIDKVRFDLFRDEIIVFTPKGDSISLPEDSTALDFAYAVHTEIGNKCVQAKVNGKIKSLDEPLQGGDTIEIITRKNSKPSRKWLNLVKTHEARNSIRKTLGIKGEQKKREVEYSRFLESKNSLKRLEIPKDMQVQISRCCSFKYNDPVFAFISKENKLCIHNLNCPNFNFIDPDKKVDLSWKKIDEKVNVSLRLILDNAVGVAALVLTHIANQGINLNKIHTDPKKDKAIMHINIESIKEKDLENLLNSLKELAPVQQILIK